MSDFLANLGVGLAGGAGNIVATALANRANRKLAEYSYDQQKQMIAEQNAYNSPLQQMKRYEEAGLNPNLIYGSGQASAGNQSGIAKYDAPTMQAPNIADSIAKTFDMAMQLKMMRKELDIKDVELSNKYVENGLLNQDLISRRRNNVIQSILVGVPDDTNGYSETELEDIRNSPLFSKYLSEVDIAQQNALLVEAKNKFQDLKNDEQEFVVKNIQPLTEQFMKLRNDGMSINNAIQQVRADMNESLKSIGGERGAGLIWLVIRAILMALPK